MTPYKDMYRCKKNNDSMLTKTHAIVLRTIKYGESSLIADTLTEAMGRIAFMIRISKTTKAKVKKQFFQPLT